MFTSQDAKWMQRALALSAHAANHNEVPVGAVLVSKDQVIGEGFNQSITCIDPTAHAEIIAMRTGAISLANYRLTHTTLYVTLEPCLMCVGAMVHARIERLIFGAFETRCNATTGITRILDQPFLNHRVAYQGGLMQEECRLILRDFFKARR